jgi:hypothetical protein
MKLTFWDHFVRVLTGKFPSRTQAELIKLEDLKNTIARIERLAAEQEAGVASAKGLVEDKSDLAPPKKKATPKTKKPSLG